MGLVFGLALAFVAGLPTISSAQSQNYSVTPDVVFGHKDGLALTFDVFRPTTQANGAGILYMVSGGWVSGWRAPEAQARGFSGLLAAGFTVFAVRHGSSPRYKVPEAHADVDQALRFIHSQASELGVDPERLGVYGGSAGGHLSLMLGLDPDVGDPAGETALDRADSRVAAIVAYYPPVDLQGWAGPSQAFPALDFDPALAPSISPILFVSPDDPPTLLIHGDADRLVPISHSQRIHEAFKAAGVESEFITIPGGDHGFTTPADRARAQSAMVAWFTEHLAGG